MPTPTRLEVVSLVYRALRWVPEAFLALFPVASYVLYCDPDGFAFRCVGLRPTRFGLRPISPDASEKKPLVPRVTEHKM